MNHRVRVLACLPTAIVATALSGCLFDGDDESCGSLSSSAAMAGCVDPGDTTCVGTRSDARPETAIRVDSYDVELPTGQWIRSEGADFDAKPPHVTLSLAGDSDGENGTTTEVGVGRSVTYAGATYRVTSFCETGVAWVVPAG